MRIGELSERTGLPPKTLRYYESIDVLPPPQRTANGYRAYDESAVTTLEFVRRAQAVGLKLGEIRSILALRDRGQTPCSHVADLIAERAAEIDEKIAELERLRGELEKLQRRAKRLRPEDCDPSSVCHVIPPDGRR